MPVVSPVPYLHFCHEKAKIDPDFDIDDVDDFPSLADLTPLRIHAKVVEVKDDTLLFRWGKDKRNHCQLQRNINEYYEKNRDKEDGFDSLGIKELTLGQFYVLEENGNFYRCKLLNLGHKSRVHLIDLGRTIEIDEEKVDFYGLVSDFYEEDDFKFAFYGVCRLADKKQCFELNIPSFDAFLGGEDVEIFLLSSQEPYYSVVNSSKLPLAPANCPTLTLSPKWIHGNNPTLVVIKKVENLGKIAVADLACSLRSCFLGEILFDTYSSDGGDVLRIREPYAHLGINVIVVAYDSRFNRFFRAQVKALSSNLSKADLVGIDHPQWMVSNYPTSDLFVIPHCMESLPRMVHYFPAIPNVLDFSKTMAYVGIANHVCPPQSVALLQRRVGSCMVDVRFGKFGGYLTDLSRILKLNEDGTEIKEKSVNPHHFQRSRNLEKKAKASQPDTEKFELRL